MATSIPSIFLLLLLLIRAGRSNDQLQLHRVLHVNFNGKLLGTSRARLNNVVTTSTSPTAVQRRTLVLNATAATPEIVGMSPRGTLNDIPFLCTAYHTPSCTLSRAHTYPLIHTYLHPPSLMHTHPHTHTLQHCWPIQQPRWVGRFFPYHLVTLILHSTLTP